ncbi:MAG: tetratricopeptide repeat protein [Phycisphaerales bacterium]
MVMRTCRVWMLGPALGVIIFFMLSGCARSDHEATSLLGEPLERPALYPERQAEFERNLETARAEHDANPDAVDAIVWYGRRLAYLGRYRDAIEVYTEGLQRFPQSAELRRHRGHRYITVREFHRAIGDLRLASLLLERIPDRVEPDGMPNEAGIPLTTLHSNTWYHLGLAHYLRGEWRKSREAFGQILELPSLNDDNLVSAIYWMALASKRLDDDRAVELLLDRVEENMAIIENHEYHALLLHFKGERTEVDLLGGEADTVGSATTMYGVGAWRLVNGNSTGALELFEAIVANEVSWPAFGHIAAEAELSRWENR